METGKLIKELRIKKGMTQENLADKTEVSARTIQRIENGEVDARAYTFQMIAKALDVDFSLFAEHDSAESQEIQAINNNNWFSLLHLSGLLPIISPTIIIWNKKKDKTDDMAHHFRAAISFQLCILGISLGSLWVYWKINMLTPFIGSLLIGALMSIFNAINAMHGRPYINPFIKNRDQIRK